MCYEILKQTLIINGHTIWFQEMLLYRKSIVYSISFLCNTYRERMSKSRTLVGF